MNVAKSYVSGFRADERSTDLESGLSGLRTDERSTDLESGLSGWPVSGLADNKPINGIDVLVS